MEYSVASSLRSSVIYGDLMVMIGVLYFYFIPCECLHIIMPFYCTLFHTKPKLDIDSSFLSHFMFSSGIIFKGFSACVHATETVAYPIFAYKRPTTIATSQWLQYNAFRLTSCVCAYTKDDYRQVSNIRRNLVGNQIVDHSDVVGASPVGGAQSTSSFST